MGHGLLVEPSKETNEIGAYDASFIYSSYDALSGDTIMSQTEQAIENLAVAFSQGTLPRHIYMEALRSLVRLAISEHVSIPILAAKVDLQRVAEIMRAHPSKPL